MLKINDVIDADTAELIATELGHTVKRVSEADVEEGLYDNAADDKAGGPRPRAPRSSPSWATSTTARPRCSTPSARPTWSRAKPAASPSTSAPTRSRSTARRSPSSIPRATRRSPPCVPAAPRRPTSRCWWWRPTTASCRRPSSPSSTPRRPACRSSSPSTRWTSPTPTRRASAPSCCSTKCSSNRWAARRSTSRSRRSRRPASTSCSRPSCCRPKCSTSRSTRDGRAEGLVIEAKLDRGRGAVATVLVQRGTLAVGDIVVAGTEFARVRALLDDKGEQVKSAGPSSPVEVLGFTGVPSAGDRFSVVETEARAREVTDLPPAPRPREGRRAAARPASSR